jgi:DNA processing protein
MKSTPDIIFSLNPLPALNTLLICSLPGIGAHRYWALLEHCGSEQQVLDTDPETLPILNQQAKQLLSGYQKNPQNSTLAALTEGIITQLAQSQSIVLSVNSNDYPSLLRNINQPPPLLYCKGNPLALHLPQLAIVGSRHATHQGVSTSRLFAQHLAKCGFSITSGLALGIDGAAHQAVLNMNDRAMATGKTIAVMATGINSVYPKRHQKLADQIVANEGVLVTEFPPNTPPKAGHFPRRNRIISGLSLGVIVVEAAIKSGSLITAKYALEQGREVYAIPSSIHNPQAKGCHQLIKQGANLVESSADIIGHLDGMIAHHHIELQQSTITHKRQERPEPAPKDKLLLAHLGFAPISIDHLIETTRLSHADISDALLNLEINGWIKHSAWGYERV